MQVATEELISSAAIVQSTGLNTSGVDSDSTEKIPATVSADHSSSDEDDEPVVRSKKSIRKKVLDDSDEEDNESMGGDEPEAANEAVADSGHLDVKQNETSEVSVTKMASGDSDDDVDTPDDATCDGSSGIDTELSSMQTAEWTQHEADSTPAVKEQDLFANSDLFDAELDDDDKENKSNSDEDERNDEDSKDDHRSTETTKEAHKKTVRASRPPRIKKMEIQQIHSESQRLVRESRLRIPYHQPQKVDISVFLQRTQAKQAQLQKMGYRGPSWKIAPVSHQPGKTTIKKQSTCLKVEHMSVKPSILSNPVVDLNVGAKSLTAVDEDFLPDLDAENSIDCLPNLGERLRENRAKDMRHKVELDSGKNNKEADVDLTEFASKVQSDIAATKDTTSKPDQDSGYITTPVNSSEEENSADDNKNLDDPEYECHLSDKRTLLTPKLKHMEVASLTPQLSGGPGVFIDLSDEEDMTSKEEDSGVSQLMERLMKHSRSVPRKSSDVEISTVIKKMSEGEDTFEDLRLEKFTYHVAGEEVIDPKLNVPGAKLCLLREKLRAQMKVKREEARKKRCEMYELDNEEGFDGEEEEEAELTDQTDTDDEEVEEEEVEEEELMEEDKEKEKENNPFLDDEAEDDDDQDDDLIDNKDGDDDLQLKLDSVNYDDEASAESKEITSQNYLKAALAKTHSLALFDDNTSSSVQKTPVEKTRTFELFDEDANTESPTMSQKSNTEKHEISERPFEQLSGNSVVSTMELGSPRDPMPDDISEGKDETNVSTLSLFKDRDTSFNSTDTSFEMVGSLIPAGQRPRRRYLHSGGGRDTPDMFTGSSKSSTTTPGILSKSASRFSDLELPIEDTQDLLNNSPAPRSMAESTPRVQSQSFHFSLNYESQSQMLDDDGMLKVTSVDRKAARRQLHLDTGDSGASGSMTQELLGLCSGQFAQDSGSGKGFSGGALTLVEDSQSNADELLGLCSGRFSARPSGREQGMLGNAATQDDMGELLGLCSGKFTGEQEDGEEEDREESPMKKTKGQKRKLTVEDDDNSTDSFGVASNVSGTEDMPEENLDSDADEQDGESDQEEAETVKTALGKKHGLTIGNFVDEEAELSGSEFDSDENLDLSDSEDIMEKEAGDDDDLGTEEDLRNQVGRVHLKTLIDSDKRELMLLQEMYLPDGDLHSDGGGRFRRFRWKNVDEDTQQDMFDNSDEDEGGDEEGDTEDRWRAERHAREKFLEEQAAAEDKEEGSNSTLVRLGKATFKQKKGSRQHSDGQNSQKSASREKNTGTEKSLFKMPAKHGSLLRMNKGALAKIAEMTKPAQNVTSSKNLRKFVFTALSPEKKTNNEEVKKRPQVRRTVSVDSAKPVAKKPRLEKSNSAVHRRNSIFDLF